MQPLTIEWITKAEGDLATAWRELRARKSPNYDSACFHAQQCAEKYLKASLQEAGSPFGKTHNLSFCSRQSLANLILARCGRKFFRPYNRRTCLIGYWFKALLAEWCRKCGAEPAMVTAIKIKR